MTDLSPPAGLQDHCAAAPALVRTAVLTVSDTRTPETDESGQYLVAQLRADGHEVVSYRVVRDDAVDIRSALVAMTREAAVVLVSGGTGVSGRDVTVPVVESMLTKAMPGFGELFRMLSYAQVGGAAMFSRAVGGLVRSAAVFSMPGSLNAVQTAWTGILQGQIGHVVHEVQRHGPPALATPPAEPALRPAAPPPAPVPPAHGFPAPGANGGAAAGLGRHSRHDDPGVGPDLPPPPQR